jgi:hypothetical protein
MHDADFHRALPSALHLTPHSLHQYRPATNRLPMPLLIKEPHIQIPPVVKQRHQIRYQPARPKPARSKTAPTPLIFKLIKTILRIRSLSILPGDGLRRKRSPVQGCLQHCDFYAPWRRLCLPAFCLAICRQTLQTNFADKLCRQTLQTNFADPSRAAFCHSPYAPVLAPTSLAPKSTAYCVSI